MTRRLDITSWSRREHYWFFREFERPHFNLCAPVDVSGLRARCEAGLGPPFSIACLHAALGAVNEVEPLRTRIRGDEVVIHEVVHCGSTSLRGDETFGFVYFEYDPDLETFAAGAQAALAAASSERGLSARDEDDALCHFSVIPWVAFTSVSNARRQGSGDDSVPKIIFGRFSRDSSGRWSMPVSLEVHHALVDGLHVGQFFAAMQARLDAMAPTQG
ncbi:MAG: chloramphenicol acetyltransferase [Nannocystis sp.]|nr:chloramphenicol acetyltransferase [Nannocystis sp.]